MTNIQKVQTLIRDTSAAILSADEVQMFLDLESEDIYMAAASALRAIAADKALASKVISAGDYNENTTTMSAQLEKIAQKYEERSNSIPADAQAEVILTDFNYNEILVNKGLRGETE